MEKYGLIVEGGGMKCAYSAGILDCFIDEDISFDYVIGASAGSANAVSFLARQKYRNMRFYTDHISEPGYFGAKSFLKTGNLFGLEYIYGTLSNSTGTDPLDFPALMENPARFEAVTTSARTGKPVYFSKDEMAQDDYRIIMASSAIPAACRPVRIGSEKYFDGGVSDAIPVERALKRGCDKLVVIMSKTRDFVKEPEAHRKIYTVLCARYPNIIRALNNRHIMYSKCQKRAYELEKEGKAFIFAPSRSLPMGTYAMDPAANMEVYKLGLEDFKTEKERFMKFLGH